jgi:hypothetical protein
VCLYKSKWWEMHEGITMKMLKRVEKSVDWLVNEIGQTKKGVLLESLTWWCVFI